MSSALIVEGLGDQAFIEVVFQKLIDERNPQPSSNIQYRTLRGIGKLEVTARRVKDDTERGVFNKIGFIVDLDQVGASARLNEINVCLENVFPEFDPLTAAGAFTTAKNEAGTDLQIACYFMGVDGAGELETVLKTIKYQDSPYADCLEAWRECLHQSKHKITQKEFDKFWINNYIRLDTCSKKEQKQRDKNCNPEKLDEIIRKKPDIWDLEHECLTDLKNFLSLFLEN